MDRLYYLITRNYFRLKPLINRLERKANGIKNTRMHHSKYGKGIGHCMIKDCECK